mmetsp:Transcript_29507/g.70104  ORF Transcript_29507/g.70104 Transcript_29507/m.70104 type:complete len:86 (+) Transcript_29507:449-706(+)
MGILLEMDDLGTMITNTACAAAILASRSLQLPKHGNLVEMDDMGTTITRSDPGYVSPLGSWKVNREQLHAAHAPMPLVLTEGSVS